MSNLPPLPENDPLRPYALYMMESVQEIYFIMVVVSVAVVVLAAAFAVFAFQKYWERKEITELKKETVGLLAVIKGWHLVVADSENAKKEKLDKVVIAVEQVPDLTSKMVLEGIEEKKDSAIFKSKENVQ